MFAIWILLSQFEIALNSVDKDFWTWLNLSNYQKWFTVLIIGDFGIY